MGRIKEVKKIWPLNQHEKPVVTSINNNFGDGQVADFSRKYKAANKYVTPYERLEQVRLEKKCIIKALEGVPRGTSILNWPCGCGRLLPILKKFGHNVTSADSSSDAVSRIRLYSGLLGVDCIGEKDEFKVVDIFQTGFDDDCFGAVIINQLFRCLPEIQIHQMILKELRRICTGPIIVSFFCNTIIHELTRYEGQNSHKEGTTHQFLRSRKAFTEQVRKCGLTVEKWVPRLGLSTRQTCVVLVRDKENYDSSQVN
jgi:hypothetical protein